MNEIELLLYETYLQGNLFGSSSNFRYLVCTFSNFLYRTIGFKTVHNTL